MKVILDTDIGTDVDDCLALTVLLGSPEVDLVGITCVHADVALRAQLVGRLLRLANRTEIPVATGGAEPLTEGLSAYWEGHEGQGIIEDVDDVVPPIDEAAADFIVRTVMEQPGEVWLLPIGPLTNIALALQKEPRLFDHIAGITIMAGSFRANSNFGLPYVEHNLRCDPVAAALVLEHPVVKTLVPLDVTTRVVIRQDDVSRMNRVNSPFLNAVADQVARYPRFMREGFTFLHDPLAAGLLVQPDLMPLTDLHLDVETGGTYSAGATLGRLPSPDYPVNARVALDVEPEGAREQLILRMLAAGS